jgi:FAD:protein FMN transferase
MVTVERTVSKDIMQTDIYLCIHSDLSESTVEADLDRCLLLFREFEHNFSRFKTGNELDRLNNSEKVVVGKEMLDILLLCKKFYKQTQGLFDPTIYNSLVAEGYSQSFEKLAKNGIAENKEEIIYSKPNYSLVRIDEKNSTVSKPKTLKLDFGGIGKGFIVDKVSEFLKNRYADFCVNAGGDIFVSGTDKAKKYPYWAIDLENPFVFEKQKTEMPLFLLSNQAIATSGVNRRKWQQDDKVKNHIINPSTSQSIENELFTVTVVADTTVSADVLAKVILIKDLEAGLKHCQTIHCPAVLIAKNGKIYFTEDAKKYVWNEK